MTKTKNAPAAADCHMLQVGLRVPERLNEKLERKAEELAISKNALLLVLLDLGLRAYESEIKFLPRE